MNYEKHGELILPPEAKLKLPTNNNSRYFYNNKAKELVLDIVFNTPSNGPKEFVLNLAEPMIIDVEHDIYLDTLITYNLKSSKLPQNIAFLLFINEFNIQTKSATNIVQNGSDNSYANKINRSIVIPNEKAHETTEVIKPAQDNTPNSNTIILPATAAGSATQDYYKGFQILIHEDSNTKSASITGSSNSGKPELTLDEIKDSNNNTFNGVTVTTNTKLEIFREVNNHSTIHKGRKNNYVGTITPTKLGQITGSVSDMGQLDINNASKDGVVSSITYGNPFHDIIETSTEDVNHDKMERMIVEFKLVPRE